MALIPFAIKRLIPPGSNDPGIVARIGILHVDAGNAESLYTYFRDRSGGVESHGHIRKDGSLEQYRDTEFQADANHLANDFALSFETQGYGTGKWTDAQLETIKRVMLWARQEHGIPLRQVDSWNDRFGGWGYHTLFGAPGPWTPVAKSCPGAERKKQFHEILVPWMKSQSVNVKGATVAENRVTRARAHIRIAIRECRRAALELADVSPRRRVVGIQLLKLRAARRALKSVLKKLPPS